jgi:hypothetical protein
MAIDNNSNPLFDENAEGYQWNHEASGENSGNSSGFDFYGNPTDPTHLDAYGNPIDTAQTDFSEHEHSGDEGNFWGSQNPPASDDDTAEEYDPSDAYTDDQTSTSFYSSQGSNYGSGERPLGKSCKRALMRP